MVGDTFQIYVLVCFCMVYFHITYSKVEDVATFKKFYVVVPAED